MSKTKQYPGQIIVLNKDNDLPEALTCELDNNGDAVLRIVDAIPVAYDSSADSKKVRIVDSAGSEIFTQPNPAYIQLRGSDVTLPVDKQTILRSQAFITTTALGADTPYTSPSIDGLQYKRLTGKVFADQAGTLEIQHSDDGTTWDTLTSISVAASTPLSFDESIYTRYIRVNYINGITAQTVFRLSGYLSAE